MKTLKSRLRAAMEGPPRITQASLARACKVSAPSVNDWISGKSQSMDGANLLAAARHLGVTPEWLATGRGPMRLNTSTIRDGTESYSPLALRVESQFLTPDPDILYEALTLLVHDESQAGAYSPRAQAARLSDLYARVSADGGRLTKASNDAFVAEVMARAEGAVADGQHKGAKRRIGKRAGKR
jgi:transcriptional regulator with XRE-family HTH domain